MLHRLFFSDQFCHSFPSRSCSYSPTYAAAAAVGPLAFARTSLLAPTPVAVSVVVIVATVAVAVAVLAAVLAALGGVAAEASFPVYFSAAKTRLAPVDNYMCVVRVSCICCC